MDLKGILGSISPAFGLASGDGLFGKIAPQLGQMGMGGILGMLLSGGHNGGSGGVPGAPTPPPIGGPAQVTLPQAQPLDHMQGAIGSPALPNFGGGSPVGSAIGQAFANSARAPTGAGLSGETPPPLPGDGGLAAMLQSLGIM